MEERLAGIEGIVSQMDKRMGDFFERLGSVESRLNHVETEIGEVRKEVSSLGTTLRDKIDSNFRWIIGIMLSVLIPMWVTIILAVLVKG